jgi:UDP-N-acetylmuramyl pentapeptide synthase
MKLLQNNNYQIFNNSICTLNSKDVNKKTIFFAVKGKSTDGHFFVSEAINKNCKFAVVKKEFKNLGKKKEKKIIRCNSPLEYLENIASYKRNQSSGLFFGITGSFGKTTLKFMLSFLLNKVKKTYCSPKSFNNHFGLPLSLSNLPRNSIYNIFELGMNNKGEINNLSKLLQPDIGIITNIGPAHLEKLKNLRNIALCKSEIISNIKKNGTIFLNIDDKYFNLLKKKINQK